MSQEKVDQYKKNKAVRGKNKRKNKNDENMTLVEKLGITIVSLLLVGWIGYSAYQVVTTPDENAEVVTTQMDVTAITDYLSSLNTTDAE